MTYTYGDDFKSTITIPPKLDSSGSAETRTFSLEKTSQVASSRSPTCTCKYKRDSSLTFSGIPLTSHTPHTFRHVRAFRRSTSWLQQFKRLPIHNYRTDHRRRLGTEFGGSPSPPQVSAHGIDHCIS